MAHFLTFLLLYDSKDEMKSILKWTTGPKSRSTRRESSSKIIVMIVETVGYARIARKIVKMVAL